MANILINQGTQTTVKSDLVSAVEYPVFKLDRGAAGASSLFTGTVDAVTNLAGGTVTVLAKGTVAAGTVDTISQLPPNSWGTVVSTGTLTLGTIKAAVAGSQIFVTDLIISAGSATNVEIGSGGTSTPIMGTLYFNANGGAVINFRSPIATTSGSALVFKQSAAISPLSITAQGFVR